MSITQILELHKKSGVIIFSLMAFMIVLMVLPFASAQPILITLIRSDTCQKSITCLPLSEIAPLDTTDKRISGKITEDGRTKPYFKNHWEFYKFDKNKYIVCVECDLGFQSRSKVITIESNPNFKYVLQKDNRIVNNTFYEYTGRHIQDCQAATISSDLELIRDTINLLGNDCKVESKYNEKDTIVKPYTKLNYCGNECQHQKFMKDAKEKSKKTFLIKPDIKLKNQNYTVKVNG